MMAANRPNLWEWHAERELSRSLTTGNIRRGHRIRYRRQGEARYRSFLLLTEHGAAPAEAMVLRAIEEHAAYRPDDAA